MFKNAKLRLLMTLLGFERQGSEDVLGARWVIPSTLTSKNLEDLHHSVEHHINYPDGGSADIDNNIRRKPTGEESRGPQHQSTLNVNFGSDSEGEDIIPDGPLFPPNLRTKSDALEELKKKRRKRHTTDGDKEPLDEEVLDERRAAREVNAAARLAKIKSDLYIHASDEDSDEEADRDFFLREEHVRKAQDQRVREALFSSRLEQITGKKPKLQRGRKRTSLGDDDEQSSDSDSRKRQRRHVSNLDDDLNLNSDDDLEMGGVTRSSSAGQDDAAHHTPPTSTEDQNELDSDDDLSFGKPTTSTNNDLGVEASSKSLITTTADSDEEDNEPIASTARRRMKAGFVVDSDSE
jgi:replication fork protection complex subunit Tof1/Swi1